MSFNRVFFKNIADLLQDYYKVYPCGVVTLTLKVADQEYNVAKILRCDDTLLTFAYYSVEKSQTLPAEAREKSEESTAWPALTVPYGLILWVEFNPRKAATEREIGFTAEEAER
ncbi:MAG: hypothetical protein HY313_10895 [Acidobacteria bacterium]|nr:hypothetical protein [Acidobacteriota bacterium]